MAEKKAAKKKRKFACKTCGKEFTSGRGVGAHYKEFPAHRPAGSKPKAKKKAASGGFSSQFKALLVAIDADIRAEQAEIKTRQKNIVALMKKKAQLKKLL